MSSAKTHDLANCNPVAPSIPSVNETSLFPYNGEIVRFDEDNSRCYTVKKNVQGRFQHPLMAVSEDNPEYPLYPNGINSTHNITSIKYNGVEYLNTIATLGALEYSQLTVSSFPLYTPGNELLYTNNVANGAFRIEIPQPTFYLGSGWGNLADFIKLLIDSLNIPVKALKTHPLWWSDEDFVRLQNLTFEKHYDDDFEITINSLYTDPISGNLFFSIEDQFIFNGETVLHLRDGVDISTINPGEAPQYNDEYSILSYDYDYSIIEELLTCPTPDPFNASLSTQNVNGDTTSGATCPSMTIDCDCEQIRFSDTSNYNYWFPGHNPEFFTSRVITITKPDGAQYVYATQDMVNVIDVDEVIPPHFNSNNTFVYNILDTDVDGIYSFRLCTYPDWQPNVFYESFVGTIVKRNDKYYKIVDSNTNVDPALPTSSNYWVEYTCDDDCAKTRYCAEENMVVLCISLLRCYKKLVKDAFCAINSNPCLKSFCDNEAFMNAMKFRITLDALEFSACAQDWATAEDHVELLKTLCCCAS
jgi:hypothetical protein